MKDQILGEHTISEVIFHPDPTHLEFVHRQALTGKHITHLAGADPEGNRTERSMRGGMGITTGNSHSRLGQPQFWSNHMHNSLTTAAQPIEGDAMASTIPLEGAEHLLGQRISERSLLTDGRNDVINGGHRAFWAAHRQTLVIQCCKCLRAGHLVNQVQTDKQLSGASR